ncbi:MAG: hypothetical protein KA100_06820 [Rickettsiales bacterium]|nr:hypothetical protein [Rickettsiales bacterium]
MTKTLEEKIEDFKALDEGLPKAKEVLEIINGLQAENKKLIAFGGLIMADRGEVQKKLDEALGRMEWQPIETADKSKHITHRSSILLTDGREVFEGYCNDDWVRASNENLAFATHWAPLPEAPKLNKQGVEK